MQNCTFCQLLRKLTLFMALCGGATNAMAESLWDRLATIEQILIPARGEVVCQTVAAEFQATFCPEAEIVTVTADQMHGDRNTLLVQITEHLPTDAHPLPEKGNGWMYFQAPGNAAVHLATSKRHLLYALFCKVRDDWSTQDLSGFSEGRTLSPTFSFIVGEDGFYGFWRRFSIGYDPESAIRETARLGASHILVNALPHPYAMEDGPAGEIYYRFYQYLPDLDQFVETKLNRGTYPPEYLQANLDFLKKQAALAVKYGLTPGMHVANPRSAPESLIEKYPWLRGPRVDHPFRSYRPRYTLTLAHPIVRWHYATLLQNLLREVPEIGFLTILINDSGAGFEYTESLYPGRNGGPYLVREWTPDAVIAKKAAELILQYYQTLRDAARELHPDFRILMGLNNIKEEKQIIYDGLGDGLDRLVRTQRMNIKEDRELNRQLEKRKSFRIAHATAEGNPYIIGLPAPWLIHEGLDLEKAAGTLRLEAHYDPPSIAPFDVNRDVFRAFQFEKDINIDKTVQQTAIRMAGKDHAAALLDIWKLSDQAVRQAPLYPLYGNLGFAWYRFWVRPFVPDIEAIPVKERAYYEDYMLTVFNNPQNIDLQADALWEIESLEKSYMSIQMYDTSTFPLLDEALAKTNDELKSMDTELAERAVFEDLQIRLRAYRCYARTLRNISAWIAGIHGYIDAVTKEEREAAINMTREMVCNELENTRNLLQLWNSTETVFMPVHENEEWMHDYGPNFGELLKKKIRLMEQYGNLTPRIDPDYMWRLPDPDEIEQAPDIDPVEYLGDPYPQNLGHKIRDR